MTRVLPEFTHAALTAAGYDRQTPAMHGQPGFFCYVEPRFGYDEGWKIAWVGNDATMQKWVEKTSNWKANWPDLYAWYIDPMQRDPFREPATGEIIIKGEDPMLVEAEDAAHASA